MKILEIEPSELKDMRYKQGVVICGCSGNIYDWINTISEMLEKENVFKENNRIEKCYLFNHYGTPYLALLFKTNRVDIENFDNWWRKNNVQYGTIKLSTFVRYSMGGFNPKNMEQSMPSVLQMGGM